jgi:hypothetical protein
MNPARIVLVVALLALALKLRWADASIGTNDTLVFRFFGIAEQKEGLLEHYKVDLFNHTPLIGTFVGWIHRISGGDKLQFAFLLRAPGIFADFGTVLCLLWLRRRTGQPPWWALTLFALSPVSLMVSGYHGNVDSIMVFALTLAACACVARNAMACGLALAFALQIKVVGLLVAPALLAWWWKQGRALPFFVTTVVVTLTGWAVPLVAMPREFIGHVLAYPSYWGSWGVTMWLRLSGIETFQGVGFQDQTLPQKVVGALLKLIIFGSAFVLAWRRRGCNAPGVFVTIGLTWLVFFTFAPGFGGQYLVWLMPFVLVLSPRWFAALTLAGSVFLFRFYDVISNPKYYTAISNGADTVTVARVWPWRVGISTTPLEPLWVWWTIIPWCVFAAWMVVALRNEWRHTNDPVADPQLTS